MPRRASRSTPPAGRAPLRVRLFGGIDAATDRYRALRERYFGGDAYDFRARVLSRLAFELAATGAYDDAIVLSELNEEVNPGERSTHRTT